jgi:hypothetical protein
VRFDDRLATVLNGRFDSPRDRSSRWQQLVDILAQDGDQLSDEVVARCLRLLSLLGPDVPKHIQVARAEAVATQSNFIPLITLLSGQSSAMANAILSTVHLDEQAWLVALPHLGPIGRSILRQRSNLPPLVVRGLQYFAPGDLTLEDDQTESQEEHVDAPEIRDLVRRIEEFRSRQRAQVTPFTAPEDEIDVAHAVRFVTDSEGRIADVEHAPRGRFVGIDLSQPARSADVGCDAGTARIVGKRGKISNGRLFLLGDDHWAGTWICSAEPRFASRDGSFVGYLGTLRRPRTDEVARQDATVDATGRKVGAQEQSELLRQLTHELRSPLNAISGFAQMIEGQFAGPVSSTYLRSVEVIRSEVARLVAAIDEIDLMARLDVAPAQPHDSRLSAADVLRMVIADVNAVVERDVLTLTEHLPRHTKLANESSATVNLLKLWLQPIASKAGEDQTFDICLAHELPTDCVTMTLTMPDHNGDQGDLGLAYAAAVGMATEMGGRLFADNDQQILNLPALEQILLSEDRVG